MTYNGINALGMERLLVRKMINDLMVISDRHDKETDVGRDSRLALNYLKKLDDSLREKLLQQPVQPV